MTGEYERRARRFILYWSLNIAFVLTVMASEIYFGFYWALLAMAPLLAFDVWRLTYSWQRVKEVRQIDDDQAYLDMLNDLVEFKRQNP